MKIVIEEYQASWANEFLAHRAAIYSILTDLDPNIEHIGSTSVVGLCAKPTIDVLVGLSAADQLDATISPMIKHSYTYFKKYEPAMPYRRLFAKLKPVSNKVPPSIIGHDDEFIRGQDFNVLANIHIVVKDTPHWHRHLAFRDFLRAHPEIRDEYGRLKKAISGREFKDTNDYNDAKAAFIQEIGRQALVWYNSQDLANP